MEYTQWKQLTPELKNQRRNTIAKSYLSSPSLPNIGRAVYAYFGGYDPENPHLQGGIAPNAIFKGGEIAGVLDKTGKYYKMLKFNPIKRIASDDVKYIKALGYTFEHPEGWKPEPLVSAKLKNSVITGNTTNF